MTTSDALARSALARPDQLPLYPAATVSFFGPTLVVAPHPDDETLGCGGAIALLQRLGIVVQVLVITDGTRSHPNSRRYPAAALRALREEETRTALAALGCSPEAVTFLRLKDQELPASGTDTFAQVVERCRSYLKDFGPSTILLPWRRDPHLDHRVCWQLVRSAIPSLNPRPRLLEYPIWVWEQADRTPVPTPDEVTAWRLDIGAVLDRKLEAIAAHRSQTTDLISDDPEGFRLTPQMLEHFTRPWEIYLESTTVASRQSLGPSYFEDLYRERDDPWGFETSVYEAHKYQATLEALPKPRYRAAFEIGCSVGVLTAHLAERCDSLLAIDVAHKALGCAQERCRSLAHVRFEQMQVPQEYPTGLFDLTLISEVGYYWSREDLHRSQQYIFEHLEPGGHLLLVHWTLFAADYPLTGDAVHEAFLDRVGIELEHLGGSREECYRLDLFERI